MASVSPGSRIGPYEILFHLGEGGMGEVYRAKDTRLSRDILLPYRPTQLQIEFRTDPLSGWNLTPEYSTAVLRA